MLAFLGAESVPLVHDDDKRATPFENQPEQTNVLLGHTFTCIEHRNNDLRLLDRLVDVGVVHVRAVEVHGYPELGPDDTAIASIDLHVEYAKSAGHGLAFASLRRLSPRLGTPAAALWAQAAVAVREDDDAETLQARIQAEEHRLLPQVVKLLAQRRLQRSGRCVRIAPEARAD